MASLSERSSSLSTATPVFSHRPRNERGIDASASSRHAFDALCVVAAALFGLAVVGFILRHVGCDSLDETIGPSFCFTAGYSACEIVQDLRSVLSFATGMLVSSLLAGRRIPGHENGSVNGRGSSAEFGRSKKVKLYLYML